ncbi:MAG TPA: Hsp20/alpha crystallin family protein [Candidatus Polarisedimenticolia bacterium]|nr:Hsp20/alpha crystallin family protein [Candidatus Polarisedimenticolia bacterium]
MSSLTPYDPFRRSMSRFDRELRDMQNRFTSLFHRVPMRGDSEEESVATAQWTPPVDIVEDEREYLIKADLPEIRKEDVRVTVQDGVLSISGERRFETEEKGRRFHRVERAFGSFNRTFVVPTDADPEEVTAEFTDGLLQVHLPKSEQAKPRSIEVKVGAGSSSSRETGRSSGLSDEQRSREKRGKMSASDVSESQSTR